MRIVRFSYDSRGRGPIIALLIGIAVLIACGFVLWLETEWSVFAVCFGGLYGFVMLKTVFAMIGRRRKFGCEVNDQSIRWWDNAPKAPEGANGEIALADIARVELTTSDDQLAPLHIETSAGAKHEVPALVVYDDRRFAKALAKRAKHAQVHINGKVV